MKTTSTLRVFLALGLTVVLWASAFAGIRVGLSYYSPTHLALLRYVVASIVLAVYAIPAGIRFPKKQDVLWIILVGFVGITLYNLALNTGEQSITAGSASLLVNTVPIWTALLATTFLNERLRHWQWLGIGLSFTGAVVIALGEGDNLQLNWGAGFVLLAAISQSIYFVAQKPLLTTYRPIELTTFAIWSGALCLLPFSSGLVGTIQTTPLTPTLAVIFLGVGPGALAYTTWAYALTRLPAIRASIFLYLVPVVAIGIAWLWLGEIPGVVALLGGTLAISGVILASFWCKTIDCVE
jgi:drug/metabolite transporter (DMT)-like permease